MWVSVFALSQYIKGVKILQLCCISYQKKKKIIKPDLKVGKVAFIIKTVHFILMALTHSTSDVSRSQSTPCL